MNEDLTPDSHAETITDLPYASGERAFLGIKPNIAAMLAVSLGLFTGLAFFVVEKKSRFVRFWAAQAVVFGLGAILFAVLADVILVTLIHVSSLVANVFGVFIMVADVGLFALWLFMLVKAFKGRMWTLPVLGTKIRNLIYREKAVAGDPTEPLS